MAQQGVLKWRKGELAMNYNYVQLIEDSVESWNGWRQDHPDLRPNLSGANLSRDYLFEINLSNADLRGADLSHACLIGANLSRSDLSGANLRGAYMSEANLFCANLRQAQLVGASLRGTDLRDADLFEAQIADADLAMANLTGTCLSITFQPASLMPATPSRSNKPSRSSSSTATRLEHTATHGRNCLVFDLGLRRLSNPTSEKRLIPIPTPKFSH